MNLFDRRRRPSKEGEKNPEIVIIAKDEPKIVGRGADISLDDRKVDEYNVSSRQQAEISVTDEGPVLKTISGNFTNSIFRGGKPIEIQNGASQKLQNGDLVRFGKIGAQQYRVEWDGKTVELIEVATNIIQKGKPKIVGRGADISLDDRKVGGYDVSSRQQAEISVTDEGPVLKTLSKNFTNFIFRGGKPIEIQNGASQKLQNGDLVRFGKIGAQQYRVEWDGKTVELIEVVSNSNGVVSVRSAARLRDPNNKQEVERPNLDNVGFAKKVEHHELTREPYNDGKKLNPEYVANQTKIRSLFIDLFLNGSLYIDFIGNIKRAHRIANEGGVYKMVGQGSLAPNSGEFRTDPVKNGREKEARMIASEAKKYSDPYENRFVESGIIRIMLENIDESNSPIDSFYNNNYVFFYPSPEAIPQYMRKIASLGKEIESLIKEGVNDKSEVIKLIAKQYQYGAVIRPFMQVNNSLFMNLVNSQLKLLGLEGISHGDLDFAAQRFQPANFVKLFYDSVRKQNPSLEERDF